MQGFTKSTTAALFISVCFTLPCRSQESASKPPSAQVSPIPAQATPPAQSTPQPGAAPAAAEAPAAEPASQATQPQATQTAPAQADTKADAAAPKPLLRGYIYPEIIKPKDMYYRGPGQGVGSLFGAVGAVATMGADNSAKGQLIALMEKEHIDIAQIVLAQVQAQFGAIPSFEAKIKAIKGANLHIEIMFYGLVKTQIFSSTMYPTIRVMMTLNREGDATPVWSEKELVATAASENDKGFSYDDYMKDPEKIRIVLDNVSKIAVKRLLRSMGSKLPN